MRGTPEGREVSRLLPRPPRFLPRDFSPGIMKMEVMPRRPSVNSWASCRRVDPVNGGCDRGRSAARLEGDGQCCRGGRSATRAGQDDVRFPTALRWIHSWTGTLRDTHHFPILCARTSAATRGGRGWEGRWAEDTIITTGRIVWCTTLTHSLALPKLLSFPQSGSNFHALGRGGERIQCPLT